MRIAKAGLPFLAGAAAVTAVTAALQLWPLAVAALLGFVYLGWFFRDPERHGPEGPAVVLAPGDGRIVALASRPDGRVGVSIFLGLLDVHVNRAPSDGRVASVEHVPGRAVAAFRPESSEVNEQVRLRLDTAAGPLEMRQVVGVAARRIECWKVPGDLVRAGDRIGIMKFGSRIDLVLPRGTRLEVAVGQKVRAGETLLARLDAAPEGRS